MRPRTNWTVEVLCCSGPEREAGVWDFDENVGNLQVIEIEQIFGKRILAGYTETIVHRDESSKQRLLRSTLSLLYIMLR